MGTHLNHLDKAILMSTHSIGFYEDLTKNVFQLSSNMNLVSSSVNANLHSLEKSFFLLSTGAVSSSMSSSSN